MSSIVSVLTVSWNSETIVFNQRLPVDQLASAWRQRVDWQVRQQAENAWLSASQRTDWLHSDWAEHCQRDNSLPVADVSLQTDDPGCQWRCGARYYIFKWHLEWQLSCRSINSMARIERLTSVQLNARRFANAESTSPTFFFITLAAILFC